ncbi:hypothetical protein OLX02_14140 [Novosphingobium sp. KCTC 2891]|uniref:hypothetical protein n=1 Tax=Novosphingobium sp. KCTC 2891 TaxID=2989730 RepID=UPI002222ABB5|nr:hypothetical protein [Novosphingobium sp. KCTC 2891]MCW1383959.1 hypothetical protein [Novosphingobium sp. KCTC 2891]
MSGTGGRDPAIARFAVLQAVRLSGAVMVLLGVMAQSGNVAWLAGVPPVAGFALAMAGLAEFFFVPRFLARRWKSKD